MRGNTNRAHPFPESRVFAPTLLAMAMAMQLAVALPDSAPAASPAPYGPRIDGLAVRIQRDTLPARPRPIAIEHSDWYYRRQTVHRIASWATLPLFAAEVVTGQELFENGPEAADWAQDAHGVMAGSLAGLFAVNTVTGAWNLWDSRHEPEGRKWRTTHAILMLVADAGFAYTGYLADEAEESGARRRDHRTAALTSSSIALISYAMMLPPIRRD